MESKQHKAMQEKGKAMGILRTACQILDGLYRIWLVVGGWRLGVCLMVW